MRHSEDRSLVPQKGSSEGSWTVMREVSTLIKGLRPRKLLGCNTISVARRRFDILHKTVVWSDSHCEASKKGGIACSKEEDCLFQRVQGGGVMSSVEWEGGEIPDIKLGYVVTCDVEQGDRVIPMCCNGREAEGHPQQIKQAE